MTDDHTVRIFLLRSDGSSLSAAAILGQELVVAAQVRTSGKDVLNRLDNWGMAPLHWATLFGNTSIAQTIIEAGGDVDLLNKRYNSPIMLAAFKGFDDLVELLCRHGSDVRSFNPDGLDALIISCYADARTAPKSTSTSTSTSPATTSMTNSRNRVARLNIIKILVRYGVNIDRRDIKGNTALHECASRHHHSPVKSLLEADADVNMTQRSMMRSSLHLACDSCGVMAGTGTGTGAGTGEDGVGTRSAAQAGVETVRALLEGGANVNAVDDKGLTALDILFKKFKVLYQPFPQSSSIFKILI
jgi:ankyrin repeat protein